MNAATRTEPAAPVVDVETLNHRGASYFNGLVGVEIVSIADGALEARLRVRTELLAPNGYLHAGAIVTLADTAAGCGCLAHLPDGAKSFTTIELKSNFLGTAREGELVAHARAAHRGRTTQVWDVEVEHVEARRTIALFRCTQMLLYPAAGAA
jgi:1,4-dihydroxy-2-naphthoyl-CoA hydrolase